MLPGRPGTPPRRFGRCGTCTRAELESVRASGCRPIRARKATVVTRIVAMLRIVTRIVARGGVRDGPVAHSAQAALRRRQSSMYSMHSFASETSA